MSGAPVCTPVTAFPAAIIYPVLVGSVPGILPGYVYNADPTQKRRRRRKPKLIGAEPMAAAIAHGKQPGPAATQPPDLEAIQLSRALRMALHEDSGGDDEEHEIAALLALAL